MNRPLPPRAEILSQGDELLTGEIVDSNASYLSQRLSELGFRVFRHTAVGDDLGDLTAVLREIAGRAQLCLSTGGLGPTVDDLTAEAVACAFGRPLREDPEALRQIEARFANHGHSMPATNRKQALLPAGAVRIDNHWGTAPGFTLDQDGCRFVFLPGVPTEMRAMFDHWVAPELRQRFRLQPPAHVTLRVVDMSESLLQQRLTGLALPPGVRLGFRATPRENQVKLVFPENFSETECDELVAEIRQALGTSVFNIEDGTKADGDLVEVVDRLMRRAGASLAVLETVSCGHLAQWCSDRDWWHCGMVIPHWRRAIAHFGISTEEDLADIAQIAIGITNLLRRNTTHALAILGFHSPMEVTCLSSPIAIALATPEGIVSEYRRLADASECRRTLVAVWALDLLRRTLSTTSGK